MLHIVGRRPDGYHELQTVFQLIDLCDRIEIGVRDDGDIRRVAGPPGVPETEDLTVRAARALKEATGCPLGAEIAIKKSIPVGGGLGGGSSDAATTLLALNQMWRTGLSLSEIAAIGVNLGADVPIFTLGRSAWAEGVGDQLTPRAHKARAHQIGGTGSIVIWHESCCVLPCVAPSLEQGPVIRLGGKH